MQKKSPIVHETSKQDICHSLDSEERKSKQNRRRMGLNDED